MTLPWDGRISDDGGPRIIFIDGGRRALWARVGPVYFGDQPYHEPAVWLEYQSRYLASELSGSVLFSVRTWNEFVNSVNSRLTPSVDRRMRRRAARAFALRHLRSRTRTRV